MKVLDELKAWLNAERKARNEKKAAQKAAALVRERSDSSGSRVQR